MNMTELSQKIIKEYELAMRYDSDISKLYARVAAGTATHREAGEFAKMSGEHIGNILYSNMQDAFPDGKISREDAITLIPTPLRENYKYVTDVTEQIQNRINEKAGIGLKAVSPEFDANRARRIAEEMAEQENFTEHSEKFVLEIENASRKIVDASLQKNAGLHEAVGLEATVIREYDGVGLHDGEDSCEWCESRAGTWTYREAKEVGAFQRHVGYGCSIAYVSGKKTQIQRDWRSNQWEDVSRDVVEERRAFMGVAKGQGTRIIPPSVGARVFQSDIIDFKTGIDYHIGGDGRITNVQVFAGKGSSTPYYKAYKYANKIGGKPEEWKHVKGIAFIENEFESGRAEIHWSEHEKYGAYDPFVKRWL